MYLSWSHLCFHGGVLHIVHPKYIQMDLYLVKPSDRGAKKQTDSRFAPSQRNTSLQCKSTSHWQGADLESALGVYLNNPHIWTTTQKQATVNCNFTKIVRHYFHFINKTWNVMNGEPFMYIVKGHLVYNRSLLLTEVSWTIIGVGHGIRVWSLSGGSYGGNTWSGDLLNYY